MTTGGARDEEEVEYYQRKIYELGADVFGYAKMEILEPIISHGPAHSDENQRKYLLESSEKRLIKVLNNS